MIDIYNYHGITFSDSSAIHDVGASIVCTILDGSSFRHFGRFESSRDKLYKKASTAAF